MEQKYIGATVWVNGRVHSVGTYTSFKQVLKLACMVREYRTGKGCKMRVTSRIMTTKEVLAWLLEN